MGIVRVFEAFRWLSAMTNWFLGNLERSPHLAGTGLRKTHGVTTKIRIRRASGLQITDSTHRIHVWYIYANIGGILMVNVTIYSVHGSYGVYHSKMSSIIVTTR